MEGMSGTCATPYREEENSMPYTGKKRAGIEGEYF